MVGVPSQDCDQAPSGQKKNAVDEPKRIWVVLKEADFSTPDVIRLSHKKEVSLPQYFEDLIEAGQECISDPSVPRVITSASSLIRGRWENLLLSGCDSDVPAFFDQHLSGWVDACHETAKASDDLVRRELEHGLKLPLVVTSESSGSLLESLLSRRLGLPSLTQQPLHRFLSRQPRPLILHLLHADESAQALRLISEFLSGLSPPELDSFEFVYQAFSSVLPPVYIASLTDSLWNLSLTSNSQVFVRLHQLLKPPPEAELGLLLLPLSQLNHSLLNDNAFLDFWRQTWEANIGNKASELRLDFLTRLSCSPFANGSQIQTKFYWQWLQAWATGRHLWLPASAYPYDTDPSLIGIPTGPPFAITPEMLKWPHLRGWVLDLCPGHQLRKYLESSQSPHTRLPRSMWPPLGSTPEAVSLSVPKFRQLIGRINVGSSSFLTSNFLRVSCGCNYAAHLKVVINELSEDDWKGFDVHWPLWEACSRLWVESGSTYLAALSRVSGDLVFQAVCGINCEGTVDEHRCPLACLCSPTVSQNASSSSPMQSRVANLDNTNAREELLMACVQALSPETRDQAMKPHLENLRQHFNSIYLRVIPLLNHSLCSSE